MFTKFAAFFNSPLKIILGLIVIGAVVFGGNKVFAKKTTTPQYTTATATKGTLIISVSASGNVTKGNNLTISTTATGTVNKVYVKNGDTVTSGQKIADITLDQDSQQRQAAAYASYLGAKNSLASAQTNLWTLQNAEFVANQKFLNGAIASNDSTSDPNYIEQNATWLAAEAAYKNQTGVIAQAQSGVTSAWLNYLQISSTITAPKSGVIRNLTITPGSMLSSTTTSTNSTPSQQELCTIADPLAQTQATVDLSEIDAAKVSPGQKVTMTMDAFPNSTFTGKILVVNTNGQVSSGVTTYPATIIFDSSPDNIYPNMGVNANIITKVKDNVILVDSAAVETSNSQSTVRILKNGQVSTVNVTLGDSNDTQTEITQGVSDGDVVVTSVLSSSNSTSTSSSSPFSLLGGGARGGAVVRRVGGD